jgi:hypothetical protein
MVQSKAHVRFSEWKNKIPQKSKQIESLWLNGSNDSYEKELMAVQIMVHLNRECG